MIMRIMRIEESLSAGWTFKMAGKTVLNRAFILADALTANKQIFTMCGYKTVLNRAFNLAEALTADKIIGNFGFFTSQQ